MGQLARLDQSGGVAVVTLDAPQQHNSLDEAMLTELLDLFGRIKSDAAVRSVVVTARGLTFSAGGRLDGFRDQQNLPQRIGRLIDLAHDLVRRVLALPVPVILALNGTVAGGAIGLVLAGDYIIAAEPVRFRTAYAALGLVGDAGLTKFLTEAVGARRARNLLMTNRTFKATEALAWGMIDEIVPLDRLADRARELASELASGPTGAFRRMKTLLSEASGNSYDRQLDRERELMLEAAKTDDAEEGIRAFVEKRAPVFVGH